MFFCLLLFEGTFTSFFKDKKSKRSQKPVGIKVFLVFLLDDRRGSGFGSRRPKNIRIRRIRIRIRIRNTTQNENDPDPT
jgi:hypothetical protein